MVTHIDRKSKNLILSFLTMDSKINSYGTLVAKKNNKNDVWPLFFHIKKEFKITSLVWFEAFIAPLLCVKCYLCFSLRMEDFYILEGKLEEEG